MAGRRLACVAVLVLVGTARAGRAADAPPAPGAAPAAPSRADLVVPSEAWGAVFEGLQVPLGAPLGFSAEQMSNFGRDRCITPSIAGAFRDARAVARTSGRLSDLLLGAAKDPAELVRIAFSMTDAVAAAMLPRPKGTEWGVAWIEAGRLPADALPDALARIAKVAGGPATVLTEEQARAWRSFPEPLQRFVVRTLVGCAEGLPWLRVAFDDPFLAASLGLARADEADAGRLLRLASRPWTEEDETLEAPLSRAGFDLLGRVDRDYLALGCTLALIHVGVALAEWREAGAALDLSGVPAAGLWVDTPVGAVRFLGAGADRVEGASGPALLTVDLGGDDEYSGRQAVPSYPVAPISLLVDLGGNDRYDGGDLEGTMACGLFGLGAILDLKGNDRYAVKASGLGCGWYGAGLLYDEAGDDVYTVRTLWGEGAAHIGVGVLCDLSGNDAYECGHQSQGMGSTWGAGVLLDLAGDDGYLARDDGNKSELYLGQSVAMSQGCGYGRRADLGDGHSLAGGYGVLVDGAGDDRYHAQCWSQGCGYWWGVGILEDRSGNDTYENGKYSLGAAAHFAVGCQVDLSGDDAYNQGVTTAKNQFQGHARDGSIGVSIDGDGNDRYQFRSHCGGSGDLNSVALFWDRRGDDLYEVVLGEGAAAEGWAGTPPMGSATPSEVRRSFRDDLPTIGVFLDTGGADTYRWTDSPPRQDAKDGGRWTHRPTPMSAGVGLDLDLR